MLVLTRRPRESIIIAGQILVTVEEVSGQKVRLSFTAPPEVTIKRAETVAAQRAPLLHSEECDRGEVSECPACDAEDEAEEYSK